MSIVRDTNADTSSNRGSSQVAVAKVTTNSSDHGVIQYTPKIKHPLDNVYEGQKTTIEINLGNTKTNYDYGAMLTTVNNRISFPLSTATIEPTGNNFSRYCGQGKSFVELEQFYSVPRQNSLYSGKYDLQYFHSILKFDLDSIWNSLSPIFTEKVSDPHLMSFVFYLIIKAIIAAGIATVSDFNGLVDPEILLLRNFYEIVTIKLDDTFALALLNRLVELIFTEELSAQIRQGISRPNVFSSLLHYIFKVNFSRKSPNYSVYVFNELAYTLCINPQSYITSTGFNKEFTPYWNNLLQCFRHTQLTSTLLLFSTLHRASKNFATKIFEYSTDQLSDRYFKIQLENHIKHFYAKNNFSTEKKAQDLSTDDCRSILVTDVQCFHSIISQMYTPTVYSPIIPKSKAVNCTKLNRHKSRCIHKGFHKQNCPVTIAFDKYGVDVVLPKLFFCLRKLLPLLPDTTPVKNSLTAKGFDVDDQILQLILNNNFRQLSELCSPIDKSNSSRKQFAKTNSRKRLRQTTNLNSISGRYPNKKKAFRTNTQSEENTAEDVDPFFSISLDE